MSFQMQVISKLGNSAKHLSELTQTVIRPLLQLAVKCMEQENIQEGAFEKISTKCNVNQSYVEEWFAAIFTILRLHLRHSANSISQNEVKQCLYDLKLSSDCVEDVVTVLYGQKRLSIVNKLSDRTKFYPKIISFKWNVDITISSSILSRVLEPHIIMEWSLSTGEKHTFQVSLFQFHQLRQIIAKLLLEMQSIENITAIKNIQNG